MATQEKLLKSLDSLKQLINSNQTSDMITKKKEKIQHCNFIAEAMLNPTIKIAKNFPGLLSFTMEVLLQLCNDNESDVRMTVDECLNKIIRAMSNGSITKIQIELHKEIKHNGSARSLRAALWRFAALAHHIRPHKGKPYVVNMIPCLVKILERNEEIVHETLASSLPKILTALGCFTMDNDIKSLLKGCMNNIKSPSAVIRRTTASCILTICLNCRKPYIFISYVLNNLIDNLVPVQDSHSTALVLGVLGCLKAILPHIEKAQEDLKTQSSFGSRRDITENKFSTDKLLQIYELSLYYTNHSDHNIINASLETLNTLLLHSPSEFKNLLLSPNGITKSRIYMFETTSKLKQRSPSQLSIATTLISTEDLLLDTDISETIRTDIEKWIDESKLSVINVNYVKNNDDKEESVDGCESDIKNTNDNKCYDYSNISIGTINEYADSLKSESVAEHMDKLILSENSSEKSFSHKMDEKSVIITDCDLLVYDVDIGDYLDKNMPLLYCARHITSKFLLSGIPKTTIADKLIRVSMKNLALSCLSTILQIYPKILLMYLDKHCAKRISDAKDDISRQQISDILLLENHCDPQLRGAVRVLISSFIKSILIANCGNYDDWIVQNTCVEDNSALSMKNLMNVILKGLQDQSSTCSRQTLFSLNVALRYILESDSSLETLTILNYLPILAKDPYWLVKVRLLELITNLQYMTVQHILGSKEFQNKVIYNILFELLKDEDQRVRNAASISILKIIPLLFFEQQFPKEVTPTCKAIYYKELYLPNFSDNEIDTNINKKQSISNMPFPFNSAKEVNSDTIEESLSRIISKLFHYLLTSTSKYFIYGCIDAMCILSSTYPTTVYKKAWNCFKNLSMTSETRIFQRSTSITASASPIQETILSSSADLLNVTVHLLTNGIIGYDLNSHLHLLKLAGNIFAGKWLENMKTLAEIKTESSTMWSLFSDKRLSDLSEQFLNHVVRLLNVFSHVLEEAVPALPPMKPVLPNLPSASNLSPIKRKKSDASEKKILSPGKVMEKDEKGDKKIDAKINAMGYFANIPHYMKIYDILRVAYNNYKITLDLEASENFLGLLKTTLNTLSQILEIASLLETGRIAEEILQYLRSTFPLEATATVQCVQQLLKSLFGTNLSADIDDVLKYLKQNEKPQKKNEDNFGFYAHLAHSPYNNIATCINSLNKVSKVECDGDSVVMGYFHRKEYKKSVNKGSDKILANYIRIFEPMVIKSLKHYTITSDVKLQCQVLQLLSQLVQLRVNYCLLDSEQIFIGFILKQFEFIEEGQIILSEELIPKIFQFLVQLSYGKQHSKSIIIIPKIIQLCDGLMASGQSPITHCIPALKPIVEDVFLLRNKSNTSDFKELETTREVLVSMLLRLLEYHEIIDLFCLILNESKYCDNAERWIRWSKQVFDVFLPLMKHNKVRLDENNCMISARRLIFALHPSVFKDMNNILVVLFGEPPNKGDILIDRYVGKIFILLLIVSQMKEDKLLMKIVENQSEFAPQSISMNVNLIPDPLNVTKTSDIFENISPEVVLLRFLFRIIEITVDKCADVALNEEDNFIIQQLSSFLLYFLYIFQSGSYSKITGMAISFINEEIQFDRCDKLPMDLINNKFLSLKNSYPLLTFHWCYLLTLLNYNNRKFWASVMQLTESYGINRQINGDLIKQKRECINLEIVRIGGSIVFSDYLSEHILSDGEQMSWFLINNIETIVNFYNEAPIFEFLGAIHRDSAASGLIIQAIARKCLDNPEPTFKSKILNCLENVHPSQSGPLLIILIPKLINARQLVISRQVANTASRKIELLLTLTMDEVHRQLPKQELVHIIELLINMKLAKKHETLVGLINKLSSQFYDLSPLELDQRRCINPEYIKKLGIDKTWYLSQVKTKCCMVSRGTETAELLSKLSYEDLLNLMSHKDFNKLILHDCIKWEIAKKHEGYDKDPSMLKACFAILEKDIVTIKSVIPKPHQVYKAEGRDMSPTENKYSNRMSEMLSDELFWSYLQHLIPSVTEYIKSISTFPDIKIPESSFEDFTKLGVICLEMVNFNLHVNKNNFNIDFINKCLGCSDAIFKENYLCSILALNTHTTWLCSAINSVYKLVSVLLMDSEPLPSIPISNLSETLNNIETRSAGQAVYQLSVLVCWFEKNYICKVDIPKCLLISIKSIVISLSRLPLVNSYILTPPTAWKTGWVIPLSGPFLTQAPPIPIEYLQDIEILEEFIFRITFLGWTSRQQFEETWMYLLSVLSASPTENSPQEEINAITHSASLAVQAITSMLLQTLYHPQPGNKNVSELIHVPRDRILDESNTSTKKLKSIHSHLYLKLKEYSKSFAKSDLFVDVFNKPNLEKHNSKYSYGQLSMEYLLMSSKIAEINGDDNYSAKIFYRREKVLSDIGLDLNSCLQFLLDLYSQWIEAEVPIPLRLLQEVVKSILSISDIFREKSQYQWMLDTCLMLSKQHAIEDEVIHQYVVIAICKAVAALSLDTETFELAKKLITQSLKSAFLSNRLAGIHGLLYIIEVCVLGNTVIGGISDELHLFLPIAIEYVQCHISSSNSVLHHSQEHSLLLWALAFYVIEHIDSPNIEMEFVESSITAVLTTLSEPSVNMYIYIPLIKGIERLLIKNRLSQKLCNRVMKFSIESLRNSNPDIALPAVQLLYTCIYIEYSDQLENTEQANGIVQSNPDHLVQTIEKVSAIFDRIKKGYPFEVEILCASLSYVLNDFFSPSDILTKVITEFLSPQQRHPMQLSKVVFQVFEYAIQQSQLSLLQDWVVFSLTNFTQSFSIGMAIWCLTCFFISASSNVWLRNMFPHVQKRIGRYEYEDRKLLCIAGADFYNNLSTDLQKKTFIDTLLKVKDQVDMPFNELLGCL